MSDQLSPQYDEQVSSQDALGIQVRDNLEMVARTAQQALDQAVKELAEMSKQENKSMDDYQKAVDGLQALTQAARHATQSLRDFDQAQEAEERYADQILERTEGLAPEDAHRGSAWLDQAAEYYNRSRTGVVLAGQAMDGNNHVDHVLSQRGGSLQSQRRSFWQAIADTALSLEMMVQRVNTLPDRLAEKIVQGVTNGMQALNAVGHEWSAKMRSTYQNLQQESVQVVQQAIDIMGATRDVTVIQINNKTQDAAQFVGQRIMGPIGQFLSNRAFPLIKSVAVGVADTLSAQVREISSDFKQSLISRQQARMGQTNPEPQTTGPSM